MPFSVAANTLTIADVPDAFHAVRRFRARTLADLATGKRHR
ncbi:MAG: hypothetical protein WBJ68_11270 [Candidatus Dechloromonas phosphoritropha]